MSQIAGTTQAKEAKTNRMTTPLDALIAFVARRVGGTKAREVERFLKFAVVGAIGAAIDLSVFNILLATVLSPLNAAGEPNIVNQGIAATISFIAAVSSNFFWNRYWTYPDSRSRPVVQQIVQFAAVSLTGWLGRILWLSISIPPISALVVELLVDTDISDQLAAQLGATIALIIGIFVVMIWNFFVNRYWTYGDVD